MLRHVSVPMVLLVGAALCAPGARANGKKPPSKAPPGKAPPPMDDEGSDDGDKYEGSGTVGGTPTKSPPLRRRRAPKNFFQGAPGGAFGAPVVIKETSESLFGSGFVPDDSAGMFESTCFDPPDFQATPCMQPCAATDISVSDYDYYGDDDDMVLSIRAFRRESGDPACTGIPDPDGDPDDYDYFPGFFYSACAEVPASEAYAFAADRKSGTLSFDVTLTDCSEFNDYDYGFPAAAPFAPSPFSAPPPPGPNPLLGQALKAEAEVSCPVVQKDFTSCLSLSAGPRGKTADTFTEFRAECTNEDVPYFEFGGEQYTWDFLSFGARKFKSRRVATAPIAGPLPAGR